MIINEMYIMKPHLSAMALRKPHIFNNNSIKEVQPTHVLNNHASN